MNWRNIVIAQIVAAYAHGCAAVALNDQRNVEREYAAELARLEHAEKQRKESTASKQDRRQCAND